MESVQHRLKAIIDDQDLPTWTYAISWKYKMDTQRGQPVLAWENGYYKGEEEGKTMTTSSDLEEQARRKRALRELNALSSCFQDWSASNEDDVTDSEWFFVVSMTLSYVVGEDFPADRVWVTGLEGCGWRRAREGAGFGMRTMVCVPVAGGVVELGSTELVSQGGDLVRKVGLLFGDPTDPPIQKQSELSLLTQTASVPPPAGGTMMQKQSHTTSASTSGGVGCASGDSTTT